MMFTPNEISEEGLRTGSGATGRAWRIPQCPFAMECVSAVLDQIRLEVERGRDLPGGGGGRETGGVLFGIQEPGRINILASKPVELPSQLPLPGFMNPPDGTK